MSLRKQCQIIEREDELSEMPVWCLFFISDTVTFFWYFSTFTFCLFFYKFKVNSILNHLGFFKRGVFEAIFFLRVRIGFSKKFFFHFKFLILRKNYPIYYKWLTKLCIVYQQFLSLSTGILLFLSGNPPRTSQSFCL